MVERKAWECPKCGRVLAPHVDACPWCVPGAGKPAVKKTGPWTSPYEWWKAPYEYPGFGGGPFYYYTTTTKTEEKPSE